MKVTETVTRIVPTLKCNNRRRALEFFEQQLGMKLLLEDGAWTSLGDASKVEKLTLEEAPSNRTRIVKGNKKLAKLVIKVADPSEIESLLAGSVSYSKLYQGEKGFAFEAISPEGDLLLLHAEDTTENLSEIPSGDFQVATDFNGLTRFEVSEIILNVSDRKESQKFYDQVLPGVSQLTLVEAEGADLSVPVAETWDLCQLKFILSDFNGAALRELLPQAFLAKSGKFLTVDDPSKIELWFEGV